MMCPDTTRTGSTICAYPGCQRSVWQDPDGSYSSYCGNTHRLAMSRMTSQANNKCRQCNSKPVYVENGHVHPFCGRRCAQEHARGAAPQNGGTPTRQNPNLVCQLAGCNNPAFLNHQTGQRGEFCSVAHARHAVATGKAEACLFCEDRPKSIVNDKHSDFCSRRCADDAISAAPIIFEIPESNKDFSNVRDQFSNSWKHPTQVPTVVKVWKIYSPQEMRQKYQRYKLTVERKSGDSNTRRRWHGTRRACRIGDSKDQCHLCMDNLCFICNIIRSSFGIAHAQQRFNFGRFGRGIYTSATSSKSNDYVVTDSNSPYQAMLLNTVVMGKAVKLTVTDESLTQPPSGYDSVVGEPGGDLNYDESIVYTNDAIRPLFLIIYKENNK